MATDAEPRAEPPPAPGTSVIVPPDPANPRKLSEEFAMILREFEVENVTLREVLVLLQGRGFVLLIMLLALPFTTPPPAAGRVDAVWVDHRDHRHAPRLSSHHPAGRRSPRVGNPVRNRRDPVPSCTRTDWGGNQPT